METKEKDIVIQKVLKLPPEQVEKVMIFIAGLEAGEYINSKKALKDADKVENFFRR